MIDPPKTKTLHPQKRKGEQSRSATVGLWQTAREPELNAAIATRFPVVIAEDSPFRQSGAASMRFTAR
jgi:hypothetical protein